MLTTPTIFFRPAGCLLTDPNYFTCTGLANDESANFMVSRANARRLHQMLTEYLRRHDGDENPGDPFGLDTPPKPTPAQTADDYWRYNVDRMGGAFDDSEILHALGYRP